MIQLVQHFSQHPSERHSKWLRQRQWFIKAREERTKEKRAEADEQEQDAILGLAVEAAIATERQIAEFEARLDAYDAELDAHEAKLNVYDAAVAQALMESIERLDKLEERHRRLVERGYTASNGQKVFKSEDGTFVVDQEGELVSDEVIAPIDIPDGLPTAEEIRDVVAAVKAEKDVQRKLHDAQREIDQAREKLADARDKVEEGRDLLTENEISVDELEEIEAELEEAMPTSLPQLPASAMKLISGVQTESAPKATTEFSGAALSVPKIHIPTAHPVTSEFRIDG
ncbi:MAG: hypothetical protein AAFQ10_00010 [Pseudomonadota bacterium]